VSIYLDTSCLLKLFFPEPESARVAEMVAVERQVVVSTLTRLEAVVQVHARVEGGTLTRARAGKLLTQLGKVLASAPFEVGTVGREMIATAERQLGVPGSRVACRTLDRLHLSAMEELGLQRLLTNDECQARGALQLGYEVLVPRSPA
jgi:predicted nucleic acid-binding protein